MGFLCELSKTWAPLIGRMLLAFIFLQSAFEKVLNYNGTLKLMASRGIPEPQLLLPLALAALFAGAVMILVGWKAHWGALALILFMVPTTFYFHAFWTYPDAQQLNQFHHFVKNLAIIGALSLMVGVGSGALSVDGNEAARA